MTRWLVTLIDTVEGRPWEVCVEVAAPNKYEARRQARALHPNGHVVHVERAPFS